MFYLTEIEKYRENNGLEVKRARGGLPSSIWETYSAFANTCGGLILLGVDKKADGALTVSGVQDSYKLIKDFWNTINNRTKVNLNFLIEDDVKVYEIEGKE